jgi:3-oxoacyl-[acyl-carrier-protein] synthase II
MPKEEANRPFDKERSGFLFSQGGAAMLVIETLENAIARGRGPIAEIVGYAESCDAKSIMTMDRSGEQIARMVAALHRSAEVDPYDVDYVNAHGTGTLLNDEVEASLIERLFRKDVIVNSTKALIGHTIGASGAIEAAVTALAVARNRVHGMPNLHRPIRELNFAKQPVAAPIDAAVSLSFAFGGHNTGLLLQKI